MVHRFAKSQSTPHYLLLSVLLLVGIFLGSCTAIDYAVYQVTYVPGSGCQSNGGKNILVAQKTPTSCLSISGGRSQRTTCKPDTGEKLVEIYPNSVCQGSNSTAMLLTSLQKCSGSTEEICAITPPIPGGDYATVEFYNNCNERKLSYISYIATDTCVRYGDNSAQYVCTADGAEARGYTGDSCDGFSTVVQDDIQLSLDQCSKVQGYSQALVACNSNSSNDAASSKMFATSKGLFFAALVTAVFALLV